MHRGGVTAVPMGGVIEVVLGWWPGVSQWCRDSVTEVVSGWWPGVSQWCRDGVTVVHRGGVTVFLPVVVSQRWCHSGAQRWCHSCGHGWCHSGSIREMARGGVAGEVSEWCTGGVR